MDSDEVPGNTLGRGGSANYKQLGKTGNPLTTSGKRNPSMMKLTALQCTGNWWESREWRRPKGRVGSLPEGLPQLNGGNPRAERPAWEGGCGGGKQHRAAVSSDGENLGGVDEACTPECTPEASNTPRTIMLHTWQKKRLLKWDLCLQARQSSRGHSALRRAQFSRH